MSQKDSVRFLASQLMGVGDQARESVRSDRANALQQRYASLAESKMAEEMKQAKRNAAQFELGELSKLAAVKALVAKGVKPTEESIAAELPAASQAVFNQMDPQTKSLFGPNYQKAFQVPKVDIGFGRSVPEAPMMPIQGGGPQRPRNSFAERERMKVMNQPMNEYQRLISGSR
jgi:hypothetical protein